MSTYKPLFPWFGGKSRVASIVWDRFGDVKNYVEPFFGSGATLFLMPDNIKPTYETVNDLDGYVANFWRAVKHDPEAVAQYADNPVFENDLHARHIWLVQHRDSLPRKLEGDPDYYDPKIAGLWVWGMSSWIGSGFCTGKGPWHIDDFGELARKEKGEGGQGVRRKRPHLGPNRGVNRQNQDLVVYFRSIAGRLKNVRVCCGDWERICGNTPTHLLGLTGVFLDPPYGNDAKRCSDLYNYDSLSVATKVREWAVENGDNPKMRIALCGYEGEHTMPESWECVSWKAVSGYASQGKNKNENSKKERIWFSPHCLKDSYELNL